MMQESSVLNLSMDAHPLEAAISLSYDLKSVDGSTKACQKLIQLKDLNENVECSAVVQAILEICPIIPIDRFADLQQVIIFLQRRSSLTRHKGVESSTRARMEDVENYIELLYDDTERLKAVAQLMELSFQYSNLTELMKNEVLVGALVRLFREESKKNFDLATNVATIFLNTSQFSYFDSTLARHKIGGLTMQLVEHELKRWELWHEQMNESSEKIQRRLEFAMRKQDQLLAVCLQILFNLANDLKVEYKMVKRGILLILAKCLDHTSNETLLTVACKFLWKLSVFKENQLAMDSLRFVEKCVQLVNNSSSLELCNAILALFFNLSFEKSFCKQMATACLINFLASCLEKNQIALNLLYQLSILEDAKAIVAFTETIPTLMRILFEAANAEQQNVTKALLVNVALEKRNAQQICSSNGSGVDQLISYALENMDVLCLKIANNMVIHGEIIQQMFIKWLPQLIENAMHTIRRAHAQSMPEFLFGLECLRLTTNILNAPWSELDDNLHITESLSEQLHAYLDGTTQKTILTKSQRHLDDDLLLQIVVLMGTMCGGESKMAGRIKPFVHYLFILLNDKMEDDEFKVQIIYVFARLISHREIALEICKDDSQYVECLIDLAHDSNPKVRHLCEQTLQSVLQENKHWSKKISEEWFRWHNVHWLEMVSDGNELMDEGGRNDSLDQFNRLVLDADEILGDDFSSSGSQK